MPLERRYVSFPTYNWHSVWHLILTRIFAISKSLKLFWIFSETIQWVLIEWLESTNCDSSSYFFRLSHIRDIMLSLYIIISAVSICTFGLTILCFMTTLQQYSLMLINRAPILHCLLVFPTKIIWYFSMVNVCFALMFAVVVNQSRQKVVKMEIVSQCDMNGLCKNKGNCGSCKKFWIHDNLPQVNLIVNSTESHYGMFS